MPDYVYDRRDVDFLLYEVFGLEGLTKLEPYREFARSDFDGVLDGMIALAKNSLFKTFVAGDRNHVQRTPKGVVVPEAFRAALRDYNEGGWVAISASPEMGGMGLPMVMSIVKTELGVSASPSLFFFPALSTAAGHLLENFANEALKRTIVPRFYSGEWGGTMCLTEAEAGTSVGDLRTTAKATGKQSDFGEVYNVAGNKIFITCGEHDLADNIVHLVLARVEGDPQGSKGISLFAVPRRRFDAAGKLGDGNDVVCTAVEEKMGIAGSPTCQMSFGDNGTCEGFLIGERCKGLAYMFQMMNEARIACGIQGVGQGNLAYQWALAYAKERVQGAKVTDRASNAKSVAIIEHPDVRRNLMLCRAMGEGIRALLLQAGFHADIAHHGATDEEKQKAQDLLDLLTPVCKAYGTDIGFKITEIAMQVHGGYGYIKEYGVEQLMRDVKIASIYEGTNGVQALDLLGRKMRMRDGAAFMTWLQEASGFLAQHAEHPRLKDLVEKVDGAKNQLGDAAMAFVAQSKQDPELPLLSATPFLEMFGHVETARLWVQQAVIADKALEKLLADKGKTFDDVKVLAKDNEAVRFYDGKLKTARFFVQQILPHATALAKSIKSADRSALDVVF